MPRVDNADLTRVPVLVAAWPVVVLLRRPGVPVVAALQDPTGTAVLTIGALPLRTTAPMRPRVSSWSSLPRAASVDLMKHPV